MYNDFAAIYYMLLEEWPRGSLLLGDPACRQCYSHPALSLIQDHTTMVGSDLLYGGVIGPGNERRRSPIEIVGKNGKGRGGDGDEREVEGRRTVTRGRWRGRGVGMSDLM